MSKHFAVQVLFPARTLLESWPMTLRVAWSSPSTPSADQSRSRPLEHRSKEALFGCGCQHPSSGGG
eukprot:10953779-Alexandrium_andersonii.AAC.1